MEARPLFLGLILMRIGLSCLVAEENAVPTTDPIEYIIASLKAYGGGGKPPLTDTAEKAGVGEIKIIQKGLGQDRHSTVIWTRTVPLKDIDPCSISVGPAFGGHYNLYAINFSNHFAKSSILREWNIDPNPSNRHVAPAYDNAGYMSSEIKKQLSASREL